MTRPGRDPRLSSPEWRRLRTWILDRDHGLCQIQAEGCTRYATCVDHIVARADGGDCWQPANLRAACRTCNSRDGALRTNSRRVARYRTTLADYDTRM
jgi:5-methylcytosine-specific restriction endonuclease McrA